MRLSGRLYIYIYIYIYILQARGSTVIDVHTQFAFHCDRYAWKMLTMMESLLEHACMHIKLRLDLQPPRANEVLHTCPCDAHWMEVGTCFCCRLAVEHIHYSIHGEPA